MTTLPTPPAMPGQGQRRYDAADRYCDLVMQGGITSGVVYPMAALELATAYRFRGIGGSSAGAIAAAAVAAAEHGREQGGFERLEKLCQELGSEGRLLNLFQPQAATRPLFDLLRGYLEGTKAGGGLSGWVAGLIRGVLWGTFQIALVVTLLAGVLLFVSGYLPEAYRPGWWFALPAWVHVVLPICFGVTVFVAVLIYRGWSLWRRLHGLLGDLQANHFGLCTGLGTTQLGEGLTEYLTRQLDELAGLGQGPLTFGHLKAKRPDQPIDLLIMTSDLSLRRPVRFPLDGELLVAKEDEWRRLFPAAVVEHLKAHPPTKVPGPLPAGYFYLPQGDALPVIVAVRMSLSFPLLFSAVPLYTLSAEAGSEPTAGDLKRSYFSDGGIVSNFPIHLFDRWLPDCPTFGINLAEMPGTAFVAGDSLRPDYLSVVQADGADRPPAGLEPIHLPDAHERLALEWYAIDSLLGLLEGIFYTAKNHRDTLQATLPSYRERIITIRLAGDEGGLNLNMPRAKIEAIMRRGQAAGELLRDKFNFDHHRWVRFQVILAQLEHELEEMVVALDRDAWWTAIGPEVVGEYPFPRDGEWCRRSVEIIQKMLALLRDLRPGGVSHFDDDHGPTPSPVKRLVPPE